MLNANQSAPFAGVLVGPDNYRTYSIDKIEASNFRSNLNEYVICPNQTPQLNLISVGGYAFALSVGVGAFLAGAIWEHQR